MRVRSRASATKPSPVGAVLRGICWAGVYIHRLRVLFFTVLGPGNQRQISTQKLPYWIVCYSIYRLEQVSSEVFKYR